MTPHDLAELYQDETLLHRMTSSAPPVVRYLNRSKAGAYDVTEDKEPADQIGESLSGELVQLIGGIIGLHDSEHCPDCLANPLLSEDTTRYGPRHPVRRALMDFERQCRRRHRLPTWKDHHSRPICSDMLRLMVEDGTSLLWASQAVGISYSRAMRLVAYGARFVSEWVEHWDHEAHDLDFEHDCAICQRRKTPVDLRVRARVAARPTT